MNGDREEQERKAVRYGELAFASTCSVNPSQIEQGQGEGWMCIDWMNECKMDLRTAEDE